MKYLNDFLRLGKALNTSILLCPTGRKHARLYIDLDSESYQFIVVVTVKVFTYTASNQFYSS